ncbi:MAG: hypothetical protein U0Q10_09830 [Dermatophilaceae bacterium]
MTFLVRFAEPGGSPTSITTHLRSWPIGMTHVLVVGLGLFALSYGWVRLGNR